jgi:hypothetical protein
MLLWVIKVPYFNNNAGYLFSPVYEWQKNSKAAPPLQRTTSITTEFCHHCAMIRRSSGDLLVGAWETKSLTPQVYKVISTSSLRPVLPARFYGVAKYSPRGHVLNPSSQTVHQLSTGPVIVKIHVINVRAIIHGPLWIPLCSLSTV